MADCTPLALDTCERGRRRPGLHHLRGILGRNHSSITYQLWGPRGRVTRSAFRTSRSLGKLGKTEVLSNQHSRSPKGHVGKEAQWTEHLGMKFTCI